MPTNRVWSLEMHDHGRGRGHAQDANKRRLTLVLGLAAAYSMIEIAGGVITSSLALLADAFHLLSDVAALALSLFALYIAQRPASARRTFGHSRAEILAALANGVGLAAMALMVMWSAFGRFGSETEVDGLGMIGFAAGALVYELVSLAILRRGADDNLNVRGAFLHILSDALGSLGVIASGAAIWAWGWTWTDPVASLVISTLVLRAAWGLVRDAVDVLMETAPPHLDVEEIRSALLAQDSVQGVHDLHVWSIGSGDVSLSCHLVMGDDDADKVLGNAQHLLQSRYSIFHSTMQVEVRGDAAECDTACD
jgi:cobalt-zinc-cadmium efflux system protein